MTRFLFLLVISLFLGAPAHAFGPGTGSFEDLEFVSETSISDDSGSALALCHTTDDLRFMGFTLLSTITGYALSPDACGTQIATRLGPEDMQAAQEAGEIDSALPVFARNDVQRNLTNYGLWLAIILGLVAVIIRRVKSLLGYDLRGPLRRKTTQRIISAMCHAGQCDGIIDSREIALIRRTAQRLTRRGVRTADVVKAADRTKDRLTEQDYIDFGNGLRDGEKDVLMQAVFFIALQGNRVYPKEYQFLTDLAHGIGMPGEDFRRVMNVALSDLDHHPAP